MIPAQQQYNDTDTIVKSYSIRVQDRFSRREKENPAFIVIHPPGFMNTIPRAWANERSEYVSESMSVRDKRVEGRGRFTIGIYNLRIYNPSACRSYNRATAARVDTSRHKSEVIFPGEMSREREREEFVGNARRAQLAYLIFPLQNCF